MISSTPAVNYFIILLLIANSHQQFIPYGSQQLFELNNVVTLKDLQTAKTKDASYILHAHLKVKSVWNTETRQVLQFNFFGETTVSTLRKNKKSLRSNIPKISDKPFYVTLNKDQPVHLIAHSFRDQSFLNLKRGIASLFAFKKGGAARAKDVSGECTATFYARSTTKFEKYKTDCTNWDLKINHRPEGPLGVSQHSKLIMHYELTSDGALRKAECLETHRIVVNVKKDAGSEVTSDMALKHKHITSDPVPQLQFDTIDKVLDSLRDDYAVLNLVADVDSSISEIQGRHLKKEILAHRLELGDKNIGKEALSNIFAKLLPLARITKTYEFVDILKMNESVKMMNQLLDLLAASQTIEAYNAVFEVFKFDDDDDAIPLEKYLQSLGLGTRPDKKIIEDLFANTQKTEDAIKNEKLFDTLHQTLAALARHSTLSKTDSLYLQIKYHLLEHIKRKCTDNNCKTKFIRALQNLRDPETIPLLLELTIKGDTEVSVVAMQALKSFFSWFFDSEQRKQFEDIFYQRKKKYDSSIRMMALDILLDMKPTQEKLGHVLEYLASNDRKYELKTYVIQKLNMMAENCPKFAALLSKTLIEKPHINNYHVMAQKGLTTALRRTLSKSPALNESLISIQEIHEGVLKRGSVEIVLHAESQEIKMFQLGLYSVGLPSWFVVHEDDEIEDEIEDAKIDENPVTAGMEISVQGVQLRPLVFFNGQTELLNHIWGGTASSPTPAYQATTLDQDQEHYIILHSGPTVYIRVLGTRSINLKGQVQLSLWNRNADTTINQNTSSSIFGLMTVGSSFAKLENEFVVTHNPQIALKAYVDFYSDPKLCIQLECPEMFLHHNITKTVTISGEENYTTEFATKANFKVNGNTLALNRKNNEMCNMIL